ncbi:MAG: HEAT repeat domain-containing protein, partial [Nitrospirota bacterium]|nr:HEAT repeat domain-containing protein [Nitrospirota bacterium]
MTQNVQEWIEALEDVDDATREEAAKALADLGDPQTMEVLMVALEDEYWAVRVQVGHAMAKIGGSQGIDAD